MDILQFESRKRDHIQQALHLENQATGLSGFDRIRLKHEALPDLNFSEISLETSCLVKMLATPFYVAGMTAGHASASETNLRLAKACAERGWALGVGSQRRELEAQDTASLDRWELMRKGAPGLMLFANIGISQVIHAGIDSLKRLVSVLEANALVIHLNALQEALQTEGTPDFKGGFEAIEKVAKEISIPVVIKETGCGFSTETLLRLDRTAIAAVDISGLGGTHWGRIEGARSEKGSVIADAAKYFANWGEATVDSVQAANAVLKRAETWGSGGVRSPIDAAKLIALGAHRVGYAKPALEAALQGEDALRHWMKVQEYGLRVALFCTGNRNPAVLRSQGEAWRPNVI